ncbi:MAG: VanZ family protein [Candidatus Aminicenantes bacterium]|nr:VanZ family protein [Candidatus Aminicenantes bacterium]
MAIYLTVPLARRIQRFVYVRWGREVFLYFVLSVLALGFLILLSVLIVKLKIKTPSNYIWLLITGGLYAYFALQLKSSPEEAVHFLEYGLLGYFLFRALNLSIRDKSVYLSATLFALLIGTFDEILQWIIPLRYWDFRDAGLNGLSGGLFQLAVWKVVKPKTTRDKFSRRSYRTLTIIFSVCLALFALCASNTPKRVAVYTRWLPILSFLQKEEPMSEFGFKHRDRDIGIFYSRLSLAELKKTDATQSDYWAPILDTSKDIRYDDFLAKYPPLTFPFLYELRVHTYRRNTYYGKADSASSPKDRKEFCWIAYKEDLILRKYFSQTYAKSLYRWDDSVFSNICGAVDKSKPYKSAVSARLITAFSERTMWAVVLSVILILNIINRIWRFQERRRESPRQPVS